MTPVLKEKITFRRCLRLKSFRRLRFYSPIALLLIATASLSFADDGRKFFETTPDDPLASTPQPAKGKADALASFKAGHYASGIQLLIHLPHVSDDPAADRFSAWAREIEAKYQSADLERRHDFDAAMKQAGELLEKHQEVTASVWLARAVELSSDVKALRGQPSFTKMCHDIALAARELERKQQWLACQRVYANLIIADPADASLRPAVARADRRIRILRMYVPQQFRALQVVDSPSSGLDSPITHPDKDEQADKPTEPDWRAVVHGVTRDMLTAALSDLQLDYYRDLNYRDLIVDGLTGIQVLLSTPGVERAFGEMSVGAKLPAMRAALAKQIQSAQKLDPHASAAKLDAAITQLLALNSQTVELPETVIVYEFFGGLRNALDDGTNIIWPDELASFSNTSGDVGMRIRIDVDGSFRVWTCEDSGPASVAGIVAGDRVQSIAGKSLAGCTTDDLTRLLAGAPKSRVAVRILHASDAVSRLHILSREESNRATAHGWRQTDVPGKWDYFIDTGQKIAYLAINRFTKDTEADVDKALFEIKQQGGKGMILDLRDNRGGLLSSVESVASFILDQSSLIATTKPLRKTRNPGEIIEVGPGAKPREPDSGVRPPQGASPAAPTRSITPTTIPSVLPLVVLVNGSTLSGAEVLAGAIRDHHRGLLIGQHTGGHADIQYLYPLARAHNAYLKMTTLVSQLPSGQSVQRERGASVWGVEPDAIVEMTLAQTQTALETALLLRTSKPRDVAPDACGKWIASDLQLSTAIFVMRLQLNGIEFNARENK